MLVEALADVGLEPLEPARRPGGRLARFGALRQARADREDLGLGPEQPPRLLGDEAAAPPRAAPAVSNRSTLLITTRIFLPHSRTPSRNCRSLSVNGRSAEVTNSTRSDRGHELRGDRLVLADDGVGAGRVDDVDLAQEVDGGADHVEVRAALVPRGLGPELQHVHLRGRRRHAFLQHARAEQGVDERALARVELADDDDEEELVELLDRPRERGDAVGRCVEPAERVAQRRQGPPLVGEQRLFDVRENRPCACRRRERAIESQPIRSASRRRSSRD